MSLAVLLVLLWGANPPDFAGKWEMIRDQSNFGNSEKPARMTVNSTVRDGVMHAVQDTYTEQGERTTEFDWYLDGKRHDTDKPAPGYSITHRDGNMLINERVSNDGAYREVIRVTLSKDGNTATEDVTSKSPAGMNHEKLVWRKTGK